uniref:Uncharacterized protein n=1 Tax=Lepeophtheirus salmonis TaxID=72036 RepID=A0A0K2TXW9_LEPSM
MQKTTSEYHLHLLKWDDVFVQRMTIFYCFSNFNLIKR